MPDKFLKIWEVKTGKEIRTLTGHSDKIKCVVASNEKTIISGSQNNLLNIWEINSDKEAKTLTGHSKCVSCVAVSDEKTFISGSWDHSIKIWKSPPTLVKGFSQRDKNNSGCGGGGNGGGQ